MTASINRPALGADPQAKRQPAVQRQLPIDLTEVALIAAATCAAAGSMSLSWWHDEVRAGRAPAPVIRGPRCTRWRLVDVMHYWAERAASPVDGAATLIKATKASQAAQFKRSAASPTER